MRNFEINKIKHYLFISLTYASTVACLKVCNFLISIWMARTFNANEYAVWAILLSVQTGVSTFAIVGIYEAVVSLFRKNTTSIDEPNLFRAASSVFLITSGITLATSISFIGLDLFRNVSALAYCSALLSGVLLAFFALNAQLLTLQEKHFVSLVYNFAAPAIALIVGLLSTTLNPSVETFYIGSFVGLFLATFVLPVWIQQDLSIDREYTKMIAIRLPPYVAVSFAGWLSGYGINLIVVSLYEGPEVACLTFLMSISAVMQLVSSALNQVWVPRLFNFYSALGPKQVEETSRRYSSLQGLLMGVVGALVLTLYTPAIEIVGGNLDYYKGKYIELFLLLCGYIALIPSWHCANYFMLNDSGSRLMRITITTSFIGTIIWIIFMWQLGILGIYVGFFSQMLLRSIGISLVAYRLWSVRVNWMAPLVGIGLVFVGLLITKI